MLWSLLSIRITWITMVIPEVKGHFMVAANDTLHDHIAENAPLTYNTADGNFFIFLA
ncbi:MAG: hypothetical protein QM676_09490 [Novosphingobium sp.]